MISLPHFAQVAEFPSFEKCFHTQDDILVINTQQERKKKVAEARAHAEAAAQRAAEAKAKAAEAAARAAAAREAAAQKKQERDAALEAAAKKKKTTATREPMHKRPQPDEEARAIPTSVKSVLYMYKVGLHILFAHYSQTSKDSSASRRGGTFDRAPARASFAEVLRCARDFVSGYGCKVLVCV